MVFFRKHKYLVADAKAKVSETRGKETATILKVTIGSQYKKDQFSWFKKRKASTIAHSKFTYYIITGFVYKRRQADRIKTSSRKSKKLGSSGQVACDAGTNNKKKPPLTRVWPALNLASLC